MDIFYAAMGFLGLGGAAAAIQVAVIIAIALTLLGLLGLLIYNINNNKKSDIGSPIDNSLPPSYDASSQSQFVDKIPSKAPPVYKEEPDNKKKAGQTKKELLPPAFEDIDTELPPGYIEPIKTVLTVEMLSDIICSKFTVNQNSALEPFFNEEGLPESVDPILHPYAPSREKLRLEVRSIFLNILPEEEPSEEKPSHELTENEFRHFINLSTSALSSIGDKHDSLASIGWESTHLLEEEIENSPYIKFATRGSPRP